MWWRSSQAWTRCWPRQQQDCLRFLWRLLQAVLTCSCAYQVKKNNKRPPHSTPRRRRAAIKPPPRFWRYCVLPVVVIVVVAASGLCCPTVADRRDRLLLLVAAAAAGSSRSRNLAVSLCLLQRKVTSCVMVAPIISEWDSSPARRPRQQQPPSTGAAPPVSRGGIWRSSSAGSTTTLAAPFPILGCVLQAAAALRPPSALLRTMLSVPPQLPPAMGRVSGSPGLRNRPI